MAPEAANCDENGKSRRRLALIGSISGGTLNRLAECIHLEMTSDNGAHSCHRLAGGSVDCSCDYCEVFWSRLEERLRRSATRRSSANT